MHGGFESDKGGELLTSPRRATTTCPHCPHTYVRHNGALYRIGATLSEGDEWPNLVLTLVTRNA
jgi:hypothetical protein